MAASNLVIVAWQLKTTLLGAYTFMIGHREHIKVPSKE
jgi:hypothetical protein